LAVPRGRMRRCAAADYAPGYRFKSIKAASISRFAASVHMSAMGRYAAEWPAAPDGQCIRTFLFTRHNGA
jgi:hypothetical protein